MLTRMCPLDANVMSRTRTTSHTVQEKVPEATASLFLGGSDPRFLDGYPIDVPIKTIGNKFMETYQLAVHVLLFARFNPCRVDSDC